MIQYAAYRARIKPKSVYDPALSIMIGIASLKIIIPKNRSSNEHTAIHRKGTIKLVAPKNIQSRVVLNNGATGLKLFKAAAIPERGVG